MSTTIPDAAQAELEAVLRLTSARDVLDRALVGDPVWLESSAMSALAALVDADARWLAVAEEITQ